MSGSEIGTTLDVKGLAANVHDEGDGPAVLLIHGSGPGVSAWANWRLAIPELSKRFRVIAPDMPGFGYTERPEGATYDVESWTQFVADLLDTLGLDRVSLVGNSFGGAIALRFATRHPDRVGRLVLMGAAGVDFPITAGLDAVWGYEPSVENMRGLMDVFAYDRSLLTPELAQLRYEASSRPGVQEAYASMFPAPRQRWVEALAVPEDEIRTLPHETLIVHGRDDQVIPLATSLRLLELVDRSQLHVFGRCGHWVQIEHAARFSTLVSDFLSESD
jgi:2-hydroxymuconate-semialdehyde hydrolase